MARRRTATLVALLAFAAGLCLRPPAASALPPGQLRLGGGPAFLRAFVPGGRNDGWGGVLHGALGLSRDLALDVAGLWGSHEPLREGEERSEVRGASAALRYRLDSGSFEPFALLGIGVVGGGPETSDAPFGPLDLALGLGVDLERWRGWALGLELRYLIFVESPTLYPDYLNLVLKVDRVEQLW